MQNRVSYKEVFTWAPTERTVFTEVQRIEITEGTMRIQKRMQINLLNGNASQEKQRRPRVPKWIRSPCFSECQRAPNLLSSDDTHGLTNGAWGQKIWASESSSQSWYQAVRPFSCWQAETVICNCICSGSSVQSPWKLDVVTFENKPIFRSYLESFKSCSSSWNHSLVYTKENLNISNPRIKLEECICFAVFKEVSATALGVNGTVVHWFDSTLAKDLKCKKYSPSGAFYCMTPEDVPEFTESMGFQAKQTGFLPRNPIICLIYLVSTVFKTHGPTAIQEHTEKKNSALFQPLLPPTNGLNVICGHTETHWQY